MQPRPEHQRLRLEIRPGEGGEDAAAFALELRDALLAHARRSGRAESAGDGDGRTHTVLLDRAAAGAVEDLCGTHRVQRVPRNDKRGRRHTSTASVALVEEGEANEVTLDPSECQVEFFRGSGPGGQHRNKTSTAVRLRHLPSGIMVTRTSGRSQGDNLASARADLAGRLAELERRAGADEVNSLRRQQTSTERSAKTFTHNQQRDESVSHADGRRWRMGDFLAGRIDRVGK